MLCKSFKNFLTHTIQIQQTIFNIKSNIKQYEFLGVQNLSEDKREIEREESVSQ